MPLFVSELVGVSEVSFGHLMEVPYKDGHLAASSMPGMGIPWDTYGYILLPGLKRWDQIPGEFLCGIPFVSAVSSSHVADQMELGIHEGFTQYSGDQEIIRT